MNTPAEVSTPCFLMYQSPCSLQWKWPVLMERGSDEPRSIRKLLLVEENHATIARLDERLAQQAGYQVILATDCLTALFLRSFKPDLVLVNEHLLTHNGIDLLPRLHVTKDLQNIPLLLYEHDSPASRGESIPPS